MGSQNGERPKDADRIDALKAERLPYVYALLVAALTALLLIYAAFTDSASPIGPSPSPSVSTPSSTP